MITLAIDTSCDDTSIAILEIQDSRFKVKSNVVSSQVKVHKKYGGVYPTLAKREHQKNLVQVLNNALKNAQFLNKFQKSKVNIQNHPLNLKKLKKILEREKNLYPKLRGFLKKYQKPKIDVIAVTKGPGLEPCLWVGVNFAKALAFSWDLPIIPVNHIEGHIFANLVGKCQMSKFKCQIFPAICLIVSGGHSQLILMRKIGSYRIIGETRDDAAGECFDKTARILGLGYPGGPAIADAAAKCQKNGREQFSVKLPRPMINSKDYDFSFSGLKTAVLYDFKKRPKKVRVSKEYTKEMAKEIQQAIIDVLIKKTVKAAKDYKAKTIMLGGGVAANNELRKQLNYKLKTINYKLKFLVPPKNLCTDNAAMIGLTAYFNRKISSKKWQKIEVIANLRINE